MADGDRRIHEASGTFGHTDGAEQNVLIVDFNVFPLIEGRANVFLQSIAAVDGAGGGAADHVSWLHHVVVTRRANGNVGIAVAAAEINKYDPNTKGYSLAIDASGTTLRVKITAASGVRSAVFARICECGMTVADSDA